MVTSQLTREVFTEEPLWTTKITVPTANYVLTVVNTRLFIFAEEELDRNGVQTTRFVGAVAEVF